MTVEYVILAIAAIALPVLIGQLRSVKGIEVHLATLNGKVSSNAEIMHLHMHNDDKREELVNKNIDEMKDDIRKILLGGKQ